MCSTENVDFVLSMGAEDVIDYKKSRLLGTYEEIIDTAGGRAPDVLGKRLVPKGRLVILGAEGGNVFLGLLGRSLRVAVLGPFVRSKTITLVAVETPDDLAIMRNLLASRAITMPIELTFLQLRCGCDSAP